MACAFGEYLFNDLEFPNQDKEKPAAHFNTLPYRVWSHETDYSGTIETAIADWETTTGKDVSKSLGTKVQDLPLYLIPECPPNVLVKFVRFGYIITFWDDATDTLDTESHEKISLDLRAALLSEVKLGRHSRCEFEINELYIQSLLDLLNEVDGTETFFKSKYDVFDAGLQAQTISSLHTVKWEEYKTHRTLSLGGRLISTLAPAINGIRITEEELNSVSHMLDLLNLITGLTNDYHSFHKEFDDHHSAGTLDIIHNGMAVLMSNYGYDEQEAGNVLKQEVLSAEALLMKEYETWSSFTSNSHNLRRYMFISILASGGMNHWQAISPRYHRNDLITTAEDRAQLVGRGYDGKRKLSDYPFPAIALASKEQGDSYVSTEAIGNPSGPHTLDTDILAPFVKAPAEEIVLAPWKYIRSLPGKRTLARLIESLQTWFALPGQSLNIIMDTTRMLFDASLMLDDIQDGSMLRRGRPATHAVFGAAQTLNSATYLYVKGSRQLNDLKHSRECGEIFCDELETLAFGQGLELHWRFATQQPSSQEYLIMVDNKTGGFFRLVVRLLEMESDSEHTPELLHFFTLLGRYYQIRDDYCNLVSDEYTAKKGFCDDLSEGKFSYPLIHLLQNTPSPDNIRAILFNRKDDTDLPLEMKQFILDEMEAAGSLDFTKQTLDSLFDAILEQLDRVEAKLGPNKKLRILLLWLKV
ncbi:isoprenoid synthase domain-containing protein [Aspergillus karnatakaensis]|uniref:bifunctional terpene synthase/polyprenyl synthetase family protein n=1 Tax=Aspergillus karnatakaensis TaxID=1810916 RepID=UPI003CCDF3C4